MPGRKSWPLKEKNELATIFLLNPANQLAGFFFILHVVQRIFDSRKSVEPGQKSMDQSQSIYDILPQNW